eukprot:TRINITY_DN32037_c0_g1_i1.p2 TRINITY_DN32037_c0_g1~~TRINITY_DN32037_c0_g1_i1.p2  ORF type:complete len:190 (+),score=14.18 TRINITY_DN32037_c0_g1_i1:108-677(+)
MPSLVGSEMCIRDSNWVWLKKDLDQKIISPYKLLPPLFEDIDDDQIEEFLMSSNIQEGGAAMTAYAKMQFTKISDVERNYIIRGLLKYCELDTLAMVLLWEYWNDIIGHQFLQNFQYVCDQGCVGTLIRFNQLKSIVNCQFISYFSPYQMKAIPIKQPFQALFWQVQSIYRSVVYTIYYMYVFMSKAQS